MPSTSSNHPADASSLHPAGIVAVGASLGGIEALESILAPLGRDFPVPLVVSQHLANGRSSIPELLARATQLPVGWAHHEEMLQPSRIYFAPPDHHLLITRRGDRAVAELSRGPRVCHVRPAADCMFASAASVFGRRTIGVVLSGRLYDGTAGAAAIRGSGGTVIVQDPRTCRAPGMPESAMRAGAAHFVLPPDVIAAALVGLVQVPGGPALFGLGGLTAA